MQLSVLKQYVISSITTFVTAFIIALGAQLTMNPMDAGMISTSVLASFGWVALRAAIKAVIEYLAGVTGIHTVA